MATLKSLSTTGQVGLGTGAPAPAFIGSSECDENAGTIGFGTGTTPAAGLLLTLAFGANYSDPVQSITPRVKIMPVGAAAALGIYYVSTSSSVSFYCTTAPAASQSANHYAFNYEISL